VLYGSYTVTSGSKKWVATNPIRFVPETGGIMKIATMEQIASWDESINDNQFRGTIEVRDLSGTPILINELPLEEYLMGMAEETNSTPTEKLKTMAILARSYAYYYLTQADKFPGMPYDGEDDPNTFQKYLGYGYELRHPNVAAAAVATEGTVVTYNGTVIKTPYFSASNGVATKSAKEVWGWTNTPYLVSVPDTYCVSSAFSGHGVGLSGCGAKALAEKGWSFEKIIKYYYTGVALDEIE
jgi:peptidoglycan hydrolase-like amidase